MEWLISVFSFWLILQEVLELHLFCPHGCLAIRGPSYPLFFWFSAFFFLDSGGCALHEPVW